jgi:hypothetical protein
MPPYPGFCAGFYQSRSLTADCERTLNLYPERVESGHGANEGQNYVLYGTPGKLLSGTIGSGDAGAGLVSADTLGFGDGTTIIWYAVVGDKLYYLTISSLGAVVGHLIGTVDKRTLTGPQLFPAQIIILGDKYVFVVANGKAFVAGYGPPISTTTLAALAPIAVSVVNAAGTGYAAGDQGTVNGGGTGTLAFYVVDTVDGGGGVLTYHLIDPGQGYATGTGIATTATTGAGTGFTIDITSTSGGLGYLVGDTGTIDTGKVQAFYTVNTVDGSGAVLTYTISPSGAGYATGTTISTTPGAAQPGIGSGFYVDITAVGADAWAIARQSIGTGQWDQNFVNAATWQDGYTIASLAANSNGLDRRKFYVSGLEDPTTWSAIDYGVKEANPDPIIAPFSAGELLLLLGTQTSEIWTDTGDLNFPFQRIPIGGVIEAGCISPWSIVKLDNTIMWLGTDARGTNVVYELRGLTPVRVTTHALETRWKNFQSSFSMAFAYQEAGHWFYQLTFPIENQTWVYDVTAQLWHERSSLSGVTNIADLGRYGSYATGIGHGRLSYLDGKFYLSNIGYWDENNVAILRERTAPPLIDSQNWAYYDHFRMLTEQGNPPASDSYLGTLPTDTPRYALQISTDGGQTWGPDSIAFAEKVAGGTGYAVGDTGTIAGGTTHATYQVTAVVAGAVTGFILTSGGYGYILAASVATTHTSGAGTGFTVNIVLIGRGTTGSATSTQALIEWYRLGRARQFAVRVRSLSKINQAWVNAYLDVQRGAGY